MPHKRNPVLTENLTGITRIVRAAVVPALENVALWHERDISHSSVERVFAPDATIGLDFALHRLAGVIENLLIYPKTMQANLDKLGGLVHSQQVLLALTQKGVSREDSYIGTLIDDLIHKSIAEPYRMLTSRSEYRLLLRQDNACERLSEKAYQSGLLCATDIAQIRKRLAYKHHVVASWKKGRTTPQQVDTFGLRHKISLYDFAKRNDVVLDDLLPHDTSLADKETAYGALIDIRYAGYIAKQQLTIEKMNDWKDKPIPSTLDIDAIPGLRNESREHLKEKRPKTFYAASRIAGINPADLSILLLYLSKLPGTQRP